MDYRDTVFMSVAQNLSFSKAAQELFISQPAVTRHIKELEHQLDSTLFERKGNKIYLTQTGQLCYNTLKKIKQQYDELQFQIGQLNNTHKGKLRIGASSTISQYLIPTILATFHKRYPQIELFLYNGNSFDMEQKLLENEIDMALVENETSQINIKYQPFCDDQIVAVTGSSSIYAKLKTITAAELQQIPIVLREKGSGTLEVIQKQLQKRQINIDNLNILIHLGSTEAIKNFLTNFDGIALISEKSMDKELLIKQIKKIEIKNIRLDRKFRIALKHGNEAQASKLFIQHLLSYNF